MPLKSKLLRVQKFKQKKNKAPFCFFMVRRNETQRLNKEENYAFIYLKLNQTKLLIFF